MAPPFAQLGPRRKLMQGDHHSRYHTNSHHVILLSFIACCIVMMLGSNLYLYEVVLGGSSYLMLDLMQPMMDLAVQGKKSSPPIKGLWASWTCFPTTRDHSWICWVTRCNGFTCKICIDVIACSFRPWTTSSALFITLGSASRIRFYDAWVP